MLQLREVTIRSNGKLQLYNCSCDLPKRSMIVASNHYHLTTLANAFCGKHSIENGKIILDTKNDKHKKKIFYNLPYNYTEKWRHYTISEILSIWKYPKQNSEIFHKYQFDIDCKLNDLTKVQQFIYWVSVGKSLQHQFFILNNSFQYFDYLDWKVLERFLKEDFNHESFLLLSHRYESVLNEDIDAIFEINTQHQLTLKGGEKDGDCK